MSRFPASLSADPTGAGAPRAKRERQQGAKRLYYLLSAESGFKRTGRPGETAKYLALERPLMVSLGITDEHKTRARAQLRRAGEAVVEADRSFAGIDVVRRGAGGGAWS